MPSQLTEKVEEEIERYQEVKLAVAAKEQELQEIYEIQKAASSLTALLEAQQQRRTAFEEEMSKRKTEMDLQIAAVKEDWEKQKKQYEQAAKERDALETKNRERDKEQYQYEFKREQQLEYYYIPRKKGTRFLPGS